MFWIKYYYIELMTGTNSPCRHYTDDWNDDISKDELDSEITPGEEMRYGYIMGIIDTCSL